jgi:hypothetical protein
MIRYILRDLLLPVELINIIYSFIDDKTNIKKLPVIWYKRIISSDYKYYSKYSIRICLSVEERLLNMLIHEKAFNTIHNSHQFNIENLHVNTQS